MSLLVAVIVGIVAVAAIVAIGMKALIVERVLNSVRETERRERRRIRISD